MAEPTASPSSSPPTTAAAPAAAARAQRSRWRRAWRALAVLFVSLLLVLIAALGSAWWWAGQADSLASLITRVARWLPEGQSLEARDVSGTLREGGHIGWLRWRGPTLSVEVENTDIGWKLQPLLQREVQVGKLHAQRLEISSTPPAEASPTEPLQQLRLPVRIQLPFEIDQLIWNGPPRAEVQQLKGNYSYDGEHHRLDVAQLDWADGSYRAQVQLQGDAPMQLQATLSGRLEAPLPNQERSQTVEAEARITGTLATEAARLEITADAKAPSDSAALAPSAHVTAVVRPWLAQPLEQASATFEQLDVAAFWPAGPRTLLAGSLQAGPEADGSWALQTQLNNAKAGPWDKQQLPLDRLQASLRYAEGVWEVRESRADIGQGHVALQGRYTAASQTVEGRAEVARLNPADLYSTLEAAPLQGRVEATTREDQSVAFTAALQAEASRARRGAGKRAPLALERLDVQGEWQAPLLRLTDLRLDALQARVRSNRVEVETQTMQVTARAQAEVPGGKLDIDGQLGREAGKGRADLAIASAPALLQWVRGLPGVSDPLAGAKLEGQGQLALQWQGGWGKLLQRLQAPAGQLPAAPTGLQLQADLDVPSLRYLAAGAEPLAVQGLKLNLKGTPEQAQVDLQGKAQMGERKLQLNTALVGGLSSLRSGAASDWQARIDRLQASAELGKEFPGTWAVQLQSPLTVRQSSPGQTVRTTQFDASAGALIVTPPSLFEGQSRIEWQAVTARAQPKGSWAIKTQGRLLGLPMAWIAALGVQGKEGPLTRAGISGDLKLNGDWNIDTTGPQLQASATLERAEGDIRIAVDEGNTATIVRSSGPSASSNSGETKSTARAVTVQGARMRARIQQARLNVKAQGDDIVAQLDWASERAGNVKAQLGTRLARSEGGWAWPEDAPLSGKVSAQLPDVGIWSLFAPPGWRASGTFSADATLSGSRLDPRWQGTLQASRLGIASLLDGVDLKNGTLNGSFAGNQLNITQLRFEGGQGSSARILGYSGNLTAAPVSGGELVGQGSIRWDKLGESEGSGLRMQFSAEARKLQVLVRADRQLSVSGNLQAQLDQGLWTLRGKLTADRAAILLPEDSAPSLDSDVIVRSAASRKAQQEAQARQASQTSAKAQTAKPPDIAVSLDLGNDFALQGFGITTRLVGQLEVLGPVQAGGPPRITGEVRTEQGRYRAWGQSLDVETGIVRFNGSYDNPSLDILAIRPNISVRAGVQVTGSASDPRVRLYSDPEMPDAEKLSWVVMGRDPSEGGAEAALLQQAALALLSRGGTGENFAGRVGLDEIGFKGPGSSDSSDGAALTLGKRLSKNLYITYEQSLSGAMGTLYVFYDLSRRLTLRGQTGEKSAVDLIYTVRKD